MTALSGQFEQTWQRPSIAQERLTTIDGWIREEVLYREGLGMSLDQYDPIIRRLIGQKTAIISEGQVAGSPDDGELHDHPEEYRSPTAPLPER